MTIAITASGSTYQFFSDTDYRRIKRSGVASDYECFAWGTVLQPEEGDYFQGEMIIGIPIHHRVIPVKILVGQLVVGRPSAFIAKRDGQIVIRLSEPVVELQAPEINEGPLGPLPDEVLKMLNIEEDETE